MYCWLSKIARTKTPASVCEETMNTHTQGKSSIYAKHFLLPTYIKQNILQCNLSLFYVPHLNTEPMLHTCMWIFGVRRAESIKSLAVKEGRPSPNPQPSRSLLEKTDHWQKE